MGMAPGKPKMAGPKFAAKEKGTEALLSQIIEKEFDSIHKQ
jgi:hypothetical protein